MKTRLALSFSSWRSCRLARPRKLRARAATVTSARYANNSTETAPPAEGPEADIPAEGPHDVNVNPAYMPTPLLRDFAISGP